MEAALHIEDLMDPADFRLGLEVVINDARTPTEEEKVPGTDASQFLSFRITFHPLDPNIPSHQAGSCCIGVRKGIQRTGNQDHRSFKHSGNRWPCPVP